ncbi:hypothetical protein EDM68_04080 [Candidatus Uhrbacteria bacterium]|nr:MAG: hypothetical protein EDM68_04080 [Candidatus Uhrbacteria bacterium]
MEKKMMAVALGAAMTLSLIGAPTASAQVTCPAHAHAETATVAYCDENGRATCEDRCVCDRGWHPRDRSQPVSDSNPCVRNVRGDRDGDGTVDIPNTVCLAPARELTVPGGLIVCQCPDALDTEDRNGDGTPDHDADQNGIRETRRVRVDWDRHERRAMGVALTGVVQTCMAASSGLATQAEIDAAAIERRLTWLEQQIRTICGTTDETATPDDVAEDCARFREEALRGGVTSITIGDRNYTLGEFAERVMGRLAEIDATNQRQDDQLAVIDGRVTALERGWRGFLNATHIRLGGFGRLGFSTAGPATGAGGVSAELLFRFGDAPIGAYGRIEFGGQETAWNVGGSMYLAGGAGLTYFTGGRRDTTLSLGFWAEDLLEPFADVPGQEVEGSHLGVSVGAELSVSIPLPGDAYWVRIRGAVALADSQRYFVNNGVLGVLSGAYIAPSLGLEFQPDL